VARPPGTFARQRGQKMNFVEFLFQGRSRDDWMREYARAHQHPMNKLCHTIGIPLVALSIVALVASLVTPLGWKPGAALFIVGWIFQFVGHAYEGKPPEFFKDWRFLFVGLSWWFAKIRGRA
jgi:uncharacterized membrane protein YGL010W